MTSDKRQVTSEKYLLPTAYRLLRKCLVLPGSGGSTWHFAVLISLSMLSGCGRTITHVPDEADASTAPVSQAASQPAEPIPRPVAVAVDARAEEILRRADEVRNPPLDYAVVVTVTTFKPNTSPATSVYEVLVKGREKTVVKTLDPPIERNRVLLMLGKDLWAFLPDVSKPLRISLQERLTGEVANGDLARANFSGDYTPELLRVESRDPSTYDVLNLTAVSDEVTYARVVLWVEQGTYYPAQAEFYALSGRLLKTCSYERYQQLGDRLRPTRLVMHNPLINGQYSVLEYDRMRIEELPDKYFTKDYMKRMTE